MTANPPASGGPATMPPAGPVPRGKSRQSIEIDVHASVGIVRPGDKLVVATKRILAQWEVNEFRDRMAADLPGVEVVMIEAEALMVYRP